MLLLTLDHNKVLSHIHSLFCSYRSIEDVELAVMLKDIVPEYKPNNIRNSNESGKSEALEMEVLPD